MQSKNESRCSPSYSLLTEDQIKEIHHATLEILETTGVKVEHEEAQKLLKEAGCSVENNIVKFPNWVVEEAIQLAPSRFSVYSREGDLAMKLGGNNTYFGLGTDLIYTYDLDSTERRDSSLEDVKSAALVADYCDNIDFLASYALPREVETNLMYAACSHSLMTTSTKPLFFTAAGKEDLSYIVDMAAAAVSGEEELAEKPFLIHYAEPTSPLTHSTGAVNKLLFCAEKKIPINYTPGATLGGSTPVTLAGGIVQANAEALSGLVLHQAKNRGAPIVSGWALFPLDMQTSSLAYGAPEGRLTNSSFADLYNYYDLPVWSTVGSDSFELDGQASMEHALSTMMAALDGANLVHDIGYLGQGLLGNPAAILMSNEIIDYVNRFLGGYELSSEKLALDVIRSVGPEGSTYLQEKHTLENFKEELWEPDHLNRDNLDNWKDKGAKTYRDKLEEKAREVIDTHKPKTPSKEIVSEMDDILERAREDLIEREFRA